MTDKAASLIISSLSALAAICFGIAALLRERKKEDTGEGKAAGAILTELGYIKSGIDDVKAEQKEQRKINTELVTRLTAVEESTKQAHHRINLIERK
jgi:hypothetical protein